MNTQPTMSKTLSFAAVHFTVAFSLAYLITGSVVTGGLIALVEPCCNTVAYHLHEKAWARAGDRPGDAGVLLGCCQIANPARPAG